MSSERTVLKVPSATKGWNLDTWQYLPSGGTQPYPVIIMAHGFGANKLMLLSHYAEAFVSAGYACIVFDYRRWGASDGKPRHLVRVKEQLEDYRTMIKYVRQQSEFDPERVSLWGSSFSGGHVISLASEQALNIQAVISQCPYTGVAPNPPITSLIKMVLVASIDAIKQSLGLQPKYIRAIVKTGKLGGLAIDNADEGILAVAGDLSAFPNEVAASSLVEFPSYDPAKTARSISCPIILVAPELDTLCPLSNAIKVSKTAEKGQIVQVPCNHFEVYPGQKFYDASLEAQIIFLKEHVPV